MMNILDDFDYVTTFDYLRDDAENSNSETEISTAYKWIDDLGWI